jgi:hypothetical protein
MWGNSGKDFDPFYLSRQAGDFFKLSKVGEPTALRAVSHDFITMTLQQRDIIDLFSRSRVQIQHWHAILGLSRYENAARARRAA